MSDLNLGDLLGDFGDKKDVWGYVHMDTSEFIPIEHFSCYAIKNGMGYNLFKELRGEKMFLGFRAKLDSADLLIRRESERTLRVFYLSDAPLLKKTFPRMN